MLVAIMLATSPVTARGADEPRMNVVLIMADDIGVECFKLHGGRDYATPHLDALAAGGMHFTNCHAQPLCTPTRVKLMTGRSNVRSYTAFSILHPDETTIGEMAQAAGYATFVAGKWQLLGAEHYKEAAGTGTHPRDAGFDEWCLWQVEKLGSRYWGPQLDRNGTLSTFEKTTYGPDVSCAAICDFIEAHRAEPFFVYYPMALVHDPFVPTPNSPDTTAKKSVEHFGAMVEYMDEIVGRIDAKLAALGLRENTLLIFTSDNGTHRSVRSMTDSGEVRGGKRLTIDAGTHVPLIVSCPGTVPPDSTCADLVDFSDFVPTLVDACGFVPPPNVTLDGRTIWPQLRGEVGSPREWIYCYYNARPGQRGWTERRFVRDARWKLYGDGRLFETATDPLEKTPIAPGASDDADAARARLQRGLDSMPATPARIEAKPQS
ncbi:MAG: sulfatase-like hydrolase/transferase [Planctomycetota bacterium]